MPKRSRVRARARRPIETGRPERSEASRERPDRRPRYRGAPPVSGGRAIGEPSPALERAAVAERAYVVKDFGRLGKVIAAMLVLLVAGGLALNALLR